MANKRGVNFPDVFLKGAGPSAALVAAFVLGLLVVGVVSNLLYSLLTAWDETWPVAWQPAVAAAAMTALAFLLYQLDVRMPRGMKARVDESRRAPHLPGLVWLFGPGPFDHLMTALRHHCTNDRQTHCWLVMQETVEALEENFRRLSQAISDQGLNARTHRFYIPRPDAEATYEAVRTILEREALEEKLEPGQVIADLTGGTKPMTAGMVLAAITLGCPLEYVETDRDALGNPIPNTARVVLADVSFYLERVSPGRPAPDASARASTLREDAQGDATG